MKRIALVEDEELILQGLRYIIDWDALDMQVIHMAHDGQEALALLDKEPVDIIVTDVEMPQMNGIELIRQVRARTPRTRCLILSGEDDFEYARSALKLDVEDYILKPIDEEQLRQALVSAARHLDEMDAQRAESAEDKITWIKFFSGKMETAERQKFCQALPALADDKQIYLAILRVDLETLEETEGINRIAAELRRTIPDVRTIHLTADVMVLLLVCDHNQDEHWAEKLLSAFQDELESGAGIMSFISIGTSVQDYSQLPESYRTAYHLQRYRLLSGYGQCITEAHVRSRRTADVVIDQARLRESILNKDQDGALQYLEDLFLNYLQSEVDIDVPYQIVLKIVMLLQDIKIEYQMNQAAETQGLSEMIEKIYQAKDIFALRTMLMLEITAIITQLHAEKSQYTPVVRQIMSEVQENYKEDMNLKLLSYKYHMNTSYLGQIFQKEVGCTFNQYLSNTKIEKARELILHTNLKINDIAREVGCPDASYFYRKFKQYYGVSPASLRSMKKY